MELFKVNYEPGAEIETILLPLSLGKSSLALLDMVVELIRYQKSTHRLRQGFYLAALVVDETGLKSGTTNKDVCSTVDTLKERYPECKFHCHSLETLVEQFPSATIQVDDQKSGLVINGLETIDDLKSRTSRQDILGLLRKQMILAFSRKNGFKTTIWGYSTTRLAEMVLSLTSKGRGQEIPVQIDVETYNTKYQRIIYPIRDVLSSEIDIYNDLQGLANLVVESTATVPVTTKLQSIDELVHRYFHSIEEGFPSIVSTVVRTAAKLGQRPVTADSCKVCGSIVLADSQQWLKSITVSKLPGQEADQETSDLFNNSSLCYGCLMTLKGGNVAQLVWPSTSVNDVLNQYSL